MNSNHVYSKNFKQITCIHVYILSCMHVYIHSQIDGESGKKVAANLQRIQSDLQQMKTENSQLAAQLKS